jgi:LmbE family N-acetylglucosaminyl deacetylase
MRPRLAAVFAHPDDEAWTIGGTLAKHAGAIDVTIVLCTSGGNGPIWARGDPADPRYGAGTRAASVVHGDWTLRR